MFTSRTAREWASWPLVLLNGRQIRTMGRQLGGVEDTVGALTGTFIA